LIALAAVACSGPKYTASFNNVNSTVPYYAATPAPVNPNQLVASITETPVIITEEIPTVEPAVEAAVSKTYLQMNKAERKQLRSEIKSILKEQKATKKMGVAATAATKGIDHDLKLAAIFGAVGLVALIISGQVFYIIGGIALIIGVVFFVKWLVRQ
jgi:hypothetical protein